MKRHPSFHKIMSFMQHIPVCYPGIPGNSLIVQCTYMSDKLQKYSEDVWIGMRVCTQG